MAYRARAKTIVGAVTRCIDDGLRVMSPSFSMGACYNTKIERRLRFIETAEKTSDWYEFVKLKEAVRRHGSIRAAVAAGYFEERM